MCRMGALVHHTVWFAVPCCRLVCIVAGGGEGAQCRAVWVGATAADRLIGEGWLLPYQDVNRRGDATVCS